MPCLAFLTLTLYKLPSVIFALKARFSAPLTTPAELQALRMRSLYAKATDGPRFVFHKETF